MFTEMNEKAIESMNKDEPETALEYLKKADETLSKMDQKHINSDTSSSRHISQQSNSTDPIDSNYKAALYYNLACCY
jgi:tetratricopeptide (TPR) repeat protein